MGYRYIYTIIEIKQVSENKADSLEQIQAEFDSLTKEQIKTRLANLSTQTTIKQLKPFDFIQLMRDECENFPDIRDIGIDSEWDYWCYMDSEMSEFSQKYPDWIFVINRRGEDFPSFWREYYHNGKQHTCRGWVQYEPFDGKFE